MARPPLPTRPPWWPMLAWLGLLALLPWWLGLPLLLSAAAVLLLLGQRVAEHAAWLRRGLRWGLPGVLFALQRALGGDALAWGAALLGALAGYTLLVGLEAWLDRKLPRESVAVAPADWPELALAPIGPPAEIIELQLPLWQWVTAQLDDPCGGNVDYHHGGVRFADGTQIGEIGTCAGFSPTGRWFVARQQSDRGVVLWDRERNVLHRLRGWHLSGWYREQPWLVRRDGDMPLALPAVLGHDADD